jgi:hypothetical protein
VSGAAIACTPTSVRTLARLRTGAAGSRAHGCPPHRSIRTKSARRDRIRRRSSAVAAALRRRPGLRGLATAWSWAPYYKGVAPQTTAAQPLPDSTQSAPSPDLAPLQVTATKQLLRPGGRVRQPAGRARVASRIERKRRQATRAQNPAARCLLQLRPRPYPRRTGRTTRRAAIPRRGREAPQRRRHRPAGLVRAGVRSRSRRGLRPGPPGPQRHRTRPPVHH